MEKAMENVRKHKDIKLVIIEKKETIWYQNQIIILQSFLQKICWLMKWKKEKKKTLKYLWLNLPIWDCKLELNKTDVWVVVWLCKTKICWKSKTVLYGYMDTGSFIVYIGTNDIYKDIAEDVETRFETSIYEANRPLPKRKNKKLIDVMKDELSGKIMKEFEVQMMIKGCNKLIQVKF